MLHKDVLIRLCSARALLKPLGVVFTMEPTAAGPVLIAIFSDTCGNLIQFYQLVKT
jgi:hypothetical protein